MTSEKRFAISSDPTKTPSSESPHGAFEQEDAFKAGLSDERAIAYDGGNVDSDAGAFPKMCWKLFGSLSAMSFLWVGSQIGLFLFGSSLVPIYSEIGGADGIFLWIVIGYLIPNSALCPFVGALSDMFGRKYVAAVGQILLVAGPAVVSNSHSMTQAIFGMVISGLGAGLNEMIALAGTSELVPIKKRPFYVSMVIFTISPFIPSPMWAQLIIRAKNWRYVGFLVGGYNLVGLFLVIFCYYPPPRPHRKLAMEIVKTVDYWGGILSTLGVTLLMMGMQWGAYQYAWSSAHVLVPFMLGITVITAFFVWEIKYAPHPMIPKAVFSKDKRSMIMIFLITFFSGGNFFVMLIFWPTQVYNVYGDDPIQIGIRTLPIGSGIIFGAAFNLLLFGMFKGRTTFLMIFWTSVMTVFTACVSLADRHNLNPMIYAILTIANVGVGAVIFPASIMAQIYCPTEYIGTITAISLAIRYIGGAVGFTAYYNVFYHKLTEEYAIPAGLKIVLAGITEDYDTLYDLITYAAQAQYHALRDLIETSPSVTMKGQAVYDDIIFHVQEAFVLAYRWPYWISVAFGGACVVCALGLRDIRRVM
ncbi:Multidrug resistance protein 3 [Cercospora beticola]|uniref:Multidrug resistance protein 3 n=1 Tax=Cercospora beticola TaxID=122368 RepID=A0A2G5HEL6_CERBT|nr:Multidrug resistance protein 3 [Cercospora beticola]PIA91001.1 Multidrug resistance protein 3 [Cercospora beticola]WPB07943.1 hypothetical protein RHO25_012607 [Cercospora beticola]